MTVDNFPKGILAGARDLDAAFAALTKTFGPIVEVSELPGWHAGLSDDGPAGPAPFGGSSRCEHDWPPDLGDPDACCTRCGLDYGEYEL